MRLGLLRKLKILAVANVMPLGVLVYVGIQISRGRMALRDDLPLGEIGFWVVLLLVCCVAIAISSWLVMPTVRWLRDYPVWCYRHANRGVWLLPAIAGWTLYLAVWIAMTACAILIVALIAIGIWSLATTAGAVDAGAAPPAASAPP